jgi:lathosterol oxidase
MTLTTPAKAGLLVSFALMVLGSSPSLAKRLAPLENFEDLKLQSGIMLTVYVIQYLILGGLFEGTNPSGSLSTTLKPAFLALRRAQVSNEIKAGFLSLFVTILLSLGWMYVGEPRTAFYGYFEAHEWTPWWGVAGLLAYVISFDTYFYWSHMLLHESDFLWRTIHYFHHSYKEPSAFAQFAVHPLEAALQGPIGHFIVQLWFPIHPIQLAILGFLSSAWAFAAHDGRAGDFNSHYYHHSKGRGRKSYFNLGFLTPFWDVVMGTRWHPNHPLWLEWLKLESQGLVADTLDGKPGSTPNTQWITAGKLPSGHAAKKEGGKAQ